MSDQEPGSLSEYIAKHPIDHSNDDREFTPAVVVPAINPVAQGDGDGGDGHHTGEGSGGVDTSTGVEGDADGIPVQGSAGTDSTREGRPGENQGDSITNPAVDQYAAEPGESDTGGSAGFVDAAGKNTEVSPGPARASRGDTGADSSGDQGKSSRGVATGDATDAGRRDRFLANARRWLTGGVEGQQELFEYMKLNLVVNMQYDQEEGQDVRNPESKSAATQARANRKQFKETSELVMAIVQAQNEEAKKLEKK
jgi:hypothetical protein